MILRLSSKIGDPKLLFSAAEALQKACGCEILLLDARAVASERHLLACGRLAEQAFAENRSIAKSVKNETLLFVAATMKIDEAIRRAGVKRCSDFVVFCMGDCDRKKILHGLEAKELALEFGGNELAAMEKSALSRIKE
jgi:tRNA threonylcarbamoyladenosine modification (KEOPS) complex Cgi121 subunit